MSSLHVFFSFYSRSSYFIAYFLVFIYQREDFDIFVLGKGGKMCKCIQIICEVDTNQSRTCGFTPWERERERLRLSSCTNSTWGYIARLWVKCYWEGGIIWHSWWYVNHPTHKWAGDTKCTFTKYFLRNLLHYKLLVHEKCMRIMFHVRCI